MPRLLRVPVTLFCFFLFFAGSPLFGLVVFPLLRRFAPDEATHRTRVTRFVNHAQRVFTRWLVLIGIIEAPDALALPGLDTSRPYVMVANHPTLIDTVLLLGWRPELTCVAKGAWYPSLTLGPLLRQTHYLPSPRKDEDGMLDRMVAHLRAGHPLLVFPEATRSEPERLRRFRRGAIEAAFAAQVPIVPVFLGVDRPFLGKGDPPWVVPQETPRFEVEVLPWVDTTDPEREARPTHDEIERAFRTRFARQREARSAEAQLSEEPDRRSTAA